MRLASVTPSLPSSSKLSALLQPTLPKTEWMPSLSELTWWWGEGEGAHWVGGRGGKGESEEHGRGRERITVFVAASCFLSYCSDLASVRASRLSRSCGDTFR